MSNQSLFEKLELKDEKTLLIQGVPSSLEKQFIKLSYAKNVTPLLKSKKIDFALIFAINHSQLVTILKEVFSALHVNSKLWIAYPKQTSKIVSDLNRGDCNWDILTLSGFESINLTAIDNVWNAILFKKTTIADLHLPLKNVTSTVVESKEVSTITHQVEFDKKLFVPPVELEKVLRKHKEAENFFSSLSEVNQTEYVAWIEGAKREDTKQRRLDAVIEKLNSGKRSPTER
jgi:hypothetical protein